MIFRPCYRSGFTKCMHFILLFFYLVILFIIENRILNTLTNLGELSVSSFNSVSFYLMYFETPVLFHKGL